MTVWDTGSLTNLRVIQDRDELGSLWLAWYVRRSNEALAADLELHAYDARRLRVREFCTQPEAFAEVATMKMPSVEWWEERFKEQPTPPKVASVAALVVPEGWMLVDGTTVAAPSTALTRQSGQSV